MFVALFIIFLSIQSLFAFEYKEEYKENGWNVYDIATEFRRQVNSNVAFKRVIAVTTIIY